MTASISDPLVGHTVDGRYHIVRRLARGGMATVYVAIDQRLDRRIALKVMHPYLAEGTQGQAFITRFRREARAAAQLTHPNLVAVHDQGNDADISYLVMELVDGENLRNRLHHAPPLSYGRALDITSDVLAALSSVHAANLVHRDIKPENILLSPQGQVKVADFGLARAVTDMTMAATGTVLGTVAYLPPELISHGQSDARSDVYAVGATVFEMLTGRPMFRGATPIQIAVQHISGPSPRVRDVVPQIPAQLDNFVATLTARDPAQRFDNAGQALVALQKIIDELPPSFVTLTVPMPDQSDQIDELNSPQIPVTATGSVQVDDIDDTAHSVRRSQLLPAQPDIPSHDEPELIDTQVTQTQTIHVQPTQSALTLQAGSGPKTPTEPHEATANVLKVKRKKRRRLPAVIISLLAVAAIGIGWFFAFGPGAYTQVPADLVNSDEASAQHAVQQAGLHPEITYDYSDDIAQGKVIETSVPSGAKVRKNSVVELVVSQGVEYFTVPTDLVGKRKKVVRNQLTDAGFTIGTISEEYYDSIDEGIVTQISVPEGSQQPHDTVIDLTVSLGKQPVTIPDLTGLTQQEAVEKAESLGLNVKIGKPRYDNEIDQGLVSKQNPQALSQGHRTDTVTIRLSRGPELVEVPNVVGKTIESAIAELKDLGFEVKTTELWDGQFGLVRFQDPSAGSTVPKGSVVTLTVL